MNDELRTLFDQALLSLNLSFPRGVDFFESFDLYLTELKKWNKKINLTSIKNDEEIIIKHFVDSLTLLNYINSNLTLLDIGTGPGFPGIPLKIAIPSLNLILLDANIKKIIFLKHIVRKLSLSSVNIIHKNLSQKENIKDFLIDLPKIITARAFSKINDLLFITSPLIDEKSTLIIMKGKKGEEEIKNSKIILDKLKLQCINFVEFELPIYKAKRSLIIIRKSL